MIIIIVMLCVLFFCGACILECLDKDNGKGAALWAIPLVLELIYLIGV